MPHVPSQHQLDTSPRGLLRLYYGIALCTGAGILVLHTALTLIVGRPGPGGLFLLVLDALVLGMAYIGLELERPDGSRREPRGFLPLMLGLLLVALCYETGGLASPYFLLVLTTCVFSALTMRPHQAMLLVAGAVAIPELLKHPLADLGPHHFQPRSAAPALARLGGGAISTLTKTAPCLRKIPP